MASWQARTTSFVLRHWFKPRLARTPDAFAARKVMSGGSPMPAPRGAQATAATVGGIAGEWMTADGVPTVATLLYLHGGGYFACTPQTYRAVTASFAIAGFKTFAPDYRLAPENPFPAGLEDAVAAYRGLLETHSPQQLVVAGDSAGGGLSMALMLSLRERGMPLPAAAALFSPFVDLAATGESARTNSERCAMFDSESFGRAAQYYLGDRDRRAPLASPLYAELQGLPPLLIHVGADETLLDDSRRLAERAQKAGVKTQIKIWPAVPHVWQLFQRWVPEGRSSLREAGMFFAREVGAAQ
ncbi:MAG TPA: alpha/beta hydrolase [Steroidobacteraceae bacterium]|jgi:acetyl esterase/lipase|nr:alpha/beta hydrolase [Steroidobacteraceae bacterium]